MKNEGLHATAYPKVVIADDRVIDEPMLSAAFHESNLSHLITWRAGNGAIWPPDPSDVDALKHYAAGHRALYEEKDAVAAIRAFEAAIDRVPAYLQAWVSLAAAYITDNTEESLQRAEGVLTRLAQISPDQAGWLTPDASSIIHQNLAYLYVHRYRQDGELEFIRKADAWYARADALSAERPRVELLCPWAYVKMVLGDTDAARALWTRARRVAPKLLPEYAAKYAPLRAFAKEN